MKCLVDSNVEASGFVNKAVLPGSLREIFGIVYNLVPSRGAVCGT